MIRNNNLNFHVLLEDERRFQVYFKKKFPKSYKYLSIVKILTLLSIVLTANMDYHTYTEFLSSVLREEPLSPAETKSYSKYSFGFYVIIIIYEFILSVYVTLNANNPVTNVAFQIGKNAVKVIGLGSTVAYAYSHVVLMEPDVVTNFVHAKSPFGRGYDYEIGDYVLKSKGGLVASALGREDMLSAVQKHAPNSNIIDLNTLKNIISDPEFQSKIRVQTSLVEKAFIGIPLFDIPSLPTPTNLESPDVLDLNNLTSDGSNSDTEESVTPVVKKKSIIKRHHSQPLSRKSSEPVIQRRNTN